MVGGTLTLTLTLTLTRTSNVATSSVERGSKRPKLASARSQPALYSRQHHDYEHDQDLDGIWSTATPHQHPPHQHPHQHHQSRPLATSVRHAAHAWEPSSSPPSSPSCGADPWRWSSHRSSDGREGVEELEELDGYSEGEDYGQYIYWEGYNYSRRTDW